MLLYCNIREENKRIFYFDCARIGLAISKSCNPFLNAVIVQGVLFSIKLDHMASQVLHLNSPGATSGFIVLASCSSSSQCKPKNPSVAICLNYASIIFRFISLMDVVQSIRFAYFLITY